MAEEVKAEEKVEAVETSEAEVETKPEEVAESKLEEKEIEECETCDLGLTLGLITGSCELIQDEKAKEECWALVTPIEEAIEGKTEKKVEPEEVIAQLMEKYGEETVKLSLKRLQSLVEKAEKMLKEKEKEAEKRVVV